MSNENLEAKYGRRSSSQQSQNINNPSTPRNEDEAKYGRYNTFTKKTANVVTQQERDIRSNIESVLSQYSKESVNKETQKTKLAQEANQESAFKKFMKGVIMFLILLTVLCIIIALIAKPQIDFEGEQIIEQIKKSEDLYYTKIHKYHYFSKTNYDQTLGIDLSTCKYFISCEVVPNEEYGNYEIKIYGATNAFTMTYYYLKSLIDK